MSEHNDRLRDKLLRATPDELQLVANKYNETLRQLAELKHRLGGLDLPWHPPIEPAKPEPKGVPKWSYYTPDERVLSYCLVMQDECGDGYQQIDICREHYIALKERLCELLGLKPESKPESAGS